MGPKGGFITVIHVLRGALSLFLLTAASGPAQGQGGDGARTGLVVSGAVSVTNKGISTIPSLTLGRPAAIFDLAVRRERLSFEPQFRFGLDGKPWSFLFWGRYRMVEGEKLRVRVGAHPAFSFRAVPVAPEEGTGEVIVVRRYLAGDLGASYDLSRNLSVGPYWLYAYGVEEEITRHTNFLALRGTATAPLPMSLSLRLTPQLYYLRMDGSEGVYLSSGLTLSRRGVPVSVSSTATQTVRTDIRQDDAFLWNVSLNYVF